MMSNGKWSSNAFRTRFVFTSSGARCKSWTVLPDIALRTRFGGKISLAPRFAARLHFVRIASRCERQRKKKGLSVEQVAEEAKNKMVVHVQVDDKQRHRIQSIRAGRKNEISFA